MSVIFPVGLSIDVFTGAWSVSLVQNALPASHDVVDARLTASFLQVFVTTLLQGICLNAVLFVYMVFVYGALRLVAQLRNRWRCDPS